MSVTFSGDWDVSLVGASVVEGQNAAFRLAVGALLGHGADMSTGQLIDPSDGTLRLVSHAGFSNGFVEHFARLSKVDSTTCAAAFRVGKIAQVSNVADDGTFTGADLDVMLSAGVLACMSAPVFDRQGVPRGVVSAHYRRAGARRTDVLADVASALGALLAVMEEFPAGSQNGAENGSQNGSSNGSGPSPVDEVEGLRRAMASRAVIEQAKGILMAAMGCGEERAFQVLVARRSGEVTVHEVTVHEVRMHGVRVHGVTVHEVRVRASSP